MVVESIKPGYKQTEVGIIPEDWVIKNIYNNFTIKGRIGWQGLTTNEYLNNGQFFLVTGTDFKNAKINWDNCFYIDKKRYFQDKNIQLKLKDILVTKDGTIGKIAYIDKLLLPATLNSGIFVIRPKDNYIEKFLYFVLTSYIFYNFLNKLKAGSTISHLYQKDFIVFDFGSPESIQEQSAIVQVLSDTDLLIESLDKLIEKKKNIKQGAMQELLTGKRRLPGFKGGWEFYLFGNLANINKGQQINKSNLILEGDYPDWNGGITPSGYTDKWNTDAYTITISEGGNSCGFVNYCKQRFWLGGHCYALNLISNNLDKLFFYQLLKFKEAKIMGQRIGSGLPNIQKKNLTEFELYVPRDLEEQYAIAQVLSDMDTEIEELEKKRDKYKKIKIGMMQELLTGRIRLK